VTTVRQALEEGRSIEDARLILAHAVGRDPAWLYAWPERELEPAQLTRYRELLRRRAAGEPLAYLTGEKEFWSLPLRVTPATLVPRPETELLVESALRLFPAPEQSGRRQEPTPPPEPEDRSGKLKALDLGTGSGAIALALAAERPAWKIAATDVSAEALAVAKENAQRLRLENLRFFQGDWYEALPPGERFQLILCNPPYVAAEDPNLRGDGVAHEPPSALAAGRDGLEELRLVIAGAPARLEAGGWLLVEHGMDQGKAVRRLFRQAGFRSVETRRDLAGRDRATLGCYAPSP